MKRDYRLKKAGTKSEKEAIYRLRYDVYISEKKEIHPNTDNINYFVKDEFDDISDLFYIECENEVIASLRISMKKNGLLEFEDKYEMDRFKPYYPENISTTSRLIVNSEKRNGRCLSILINHIFEYGIDNGILLDFINCSEPLDKLYESMGYRRYKNNFDHPVYGSVIPLVLFGNDISYFNKIKSPFRKICQRKGLQEDYKLLEAKSHFNLYTKHI